MLSSSSALRVRTDVFGPGCLELGNSLHGGASQSLRISCDVTFPYTLEPRHPAIESGNELEQILKDGLIQGGGHGESFKQRRGPAQQARSPENVVTTAYVAVCRAAVQTGTDPIVGEAVAFDHDNRT